MTTNRHLNSKLEWLFDGKNLSEKQHFAMMLTTVSEDGWPHSAMISVGEVVCTSQTELRLAMWPKTTTTNNMMRTGKATLIFVYEGVAYYIKLQLTPLPVIPNAQHERQRFTAKIISCREDTAKYATLTSGIEFELDEPSEVVNRWAETIKELHL
ncbi:pyridoxamine 5'-phosphate oxidase family protein [Paenibacillus sediminis]|uniref:Pyridoxamine 5'-phosphate oxidase family protein n=1 Tax=Paenibacillus sediminis TaxID=664909 RepID=A0ABS4H182_9BACL|nr:hypothetical protein [Paenibacillus sediminis]